MLPASSGLIICIKNTADVIKKWDASGIGRFMEDPAAKKWMAPMYDKTGESNWNKSMREEDGLSFREAFAPYPGAIAVGFNFDRQTEEGKTGAGYAALSDIAGNEEKLTASKDSTMEAKRKKFPDIIKKTVEVGGTKVSIIAEDDSEHAKWIEAWVVIDGILLEASDEAMMEQVINTVKSGGESLNHVANLAQIAEHNSGTSDITLLLEFQMVSQMMKKKMTPEDSEAGAGAITPEMVSNAIGLEELKAAALTVGFEDARSVASFILLHDEKPKGILPALLRGTSTEVPQLAFLPASAEQVSVTRQSIDQIYDSIMDAAQKLGPMGGMMMMQLTQMEQKAGVSLRKDLFGSMDDVIATAQTMKLGTAGLPEISQVSAIKLKDSARFKSAVDAMTAMMGNGFDLFEDTEIGGQKVHKMKSTTAVAGQPSANQVAYTMMDDYLLFSQGSTDMLENVLARMKSRAVDGSIWETPMAIEALAALPKGYTGMSVSNGASIMQTMAGMLTTLQSMSGVGATVPAGKSRASGPGAKGKAVGGKPPGFSLDAKAMPGEEVFARYFGTAAGGKYSGSDYTMFKLITLPSSAK